LIGSQVCAVSLLLEPSLNSHLIEPNSEPGFLTTAFQVTTARQGPPVVGVVAETLHIVTSLLDLSDMLVRGEQLQPSAL
jgi:hypothetical protein